MTWSDLTNNWTTYLHALTQRFPYADSGALGRTQGERAATARVLADSHELTLAEARDVLDDFLLVQSLARDTADIRTHDAA